LLMVGQLPVIACKMSAAQTNQLSGICFSHGIVPTFTSTNRVDQPTEKLRAYALD
jgi:hypothetical protein